MDWVEVILETWVEDVKKMWHWSFLSSISSGESPQAGATLNPLPTCAEERIETPRFFYWAKMRSKVLRWTSKCHNWPQSTSCVTLWGSPECWERQEAKSVANIFRLFEHRGETDRPKKSWNEGQNLSNPGFGGDAKNRIWPRIRVDLHETAPKHPHMSYFGFNIDFIFALKVSQFVTKIQKIALFSILIFSWPFRLDFQTAHKCLQTAPTPLKTQSSSRGPLGSNFIYLFRLYH